MKDFSVYVKHIKGFMITYVSIIIVCSIILIIKSKSDIHIWSDQHHTAFFDIFFKIITNLGDGTFIVILSILLLFWRVNVGMLVFSTYAISGILVQILKRIVHAPRPKLYFEGIYDLHFVEGVKIYTTNSFPSGHSASAFALFLCFALLTKNRWLQAVLCFAAAMVAYSRIYLSQHFLIDVVVGSAFGVIIAIVCAFLINNNKIEWLQKPIFNFRKNNT
jgi:membrane-associated phospholipid phosphatase